MSEPGMLYVQVSRDGGKPMSVGAAIEPRKIPPAVPRPADFDQFWAGKLAALATVPLDPVLTPIQTNVAGVDTYTVKVASLGSHMQGYLARPSREGKFPALVIYQYAGVYALNTKTSTDRAAEGWLALNVDSHDMPPNEAVGVDRNYRGIGAASRETSYFLDMYLRDARAIDFIRSRPDWDGKTIVLTGTSMGGQQSLVTAALRPDVVTAVIVNEPSGADSNGDLHGRRAGYPNWTSTDPDVMRTALYFDTVNFAPLIKAPSLVSLGFIDTIAPPAGIWAALNLMPSAEVVAMVESDHNNITPEKQELYHTRSKEVLTVILTGGTFTPR
jgi:cephalosporin-C deacetylase-like acetyl esterase